MALVMALLLYLDATKTRSASDRVLHTSVSNIFIVNLHYV